MWLIELCNMQTNMVHVKSHRQILHDITQDPVVWFLDIMVGCVASRSSVYCSGQVRKDV